MGAVERKWQGGGNSGRREVDGQMTGQGRIGRGERMKQGDGTGRGDGKVNVERRSWEMGGGIAAGGEEGRMTCDRRGWTGDGGWAVRRGGKIREGLNSGVRELSVRTRD